MAGYASAGDHEVAGEFVEGALDEGPFSANGGALERCTKRGGGWECFDAVVRSGLRRDADGLAWALDAITSRICGNGPLSQERRPG